MKIVCSFTVLRCLDVVVLNRSFFISKILYLYSLSTHDKVKGVGYHYCTNPFTTKLSSKIGLYSELVKITHNTNDENFFALDQNMQFKRFQQDTFSIKLLWVYKGEVISS